MDVLNFVIALQCGHVHLLLDSPYTSSSRVVAVPTNLGLIS